MSRNEKMKFIRLIEGSAYRYRAGYGCLRCCYLECYLRIDGTFGRTSFESGKFPELYSRQLEKETSAGNHRRLTVPFKKFKNKVFTA